MKKQITPFHQMPPNSGVTPWWCRLSVAIVLSLTLSSLSYAQTKIWDKTIGGNSYDKLSISLQTSDGGYILGGTSSSGISGDKSEASRDKVEGWGLGDYWVVKLKADGTKEWDRTFGGNIEDQLRSVQQTSDGGYILGGTSSSGKGGDKSEANKGGVTDRGAPTTDYWVVKLDAIGNKLWDKTIGGNYFDELQSIQQTSDGGYILGGFSHSDIGGDKTEPNEGGLDIFGHPSPDYWVVKIDANGHKLWDKTFGGNDSDHLTSLQQTHDGGYILGGYSYSDAGGDKSEANKGEAFTGDYWIIKLKPDGAKVWDKTLGGDRDDRLVTVRQTPDGGYILGGTTTSSKSGDVSEDFTGVSDMDTGNYWVVKVDAHGNKIWDNKIGGVYEDNLTELQETKDGGYILGGTSQSVEGIDKTEGSLDNIYRGDYWIVKLNANGAKVWDKTLGSNVEDVLTSLQQTPDGTYLLGGYSNGGKSGDKSEENKGEKDESGNYTEDYWIVKLEDPDMQASAWDMRYGGSGIDNLSDVIKTSDGGYLAGGYSDSGVSGEKTQSSRGKNDYWIVKSDKNGKKLWDKRFGGSDHDYLNRVIQTQDGGYLLAGSSFSGISGDKTEESRGTISAHYGQRDYWVVKVDKAGNKQWDKRFGGSQTDELVKVVQLATGEYVLGGYSDSPAEGDKSQGFQGPYQNTDYWLVKISATGQKIWDKRYGGDHEEKLGGFTVTADGGFLLAGTSASGNTGDKSQAKRGLTDYWVVRTDKDGKLLWEKAYGGSKVEEAYSVVPGPGHTYFISGTSTSAANGSKSEPSRGGRDYWVLKIDASGKKLWDKTLGSASEDLLQASAPTREGGVVLAGTSYVGTSGEKSQYGSGDFDYWVVQLDAEGNKVRDLTLGGSAQEILRTITQTRDGGLLVGGRSKSGVSGDRTQPSQGGTDYWLVKVEPLTTTAVAAREASIVEAAIAQVEELQVQAYPNPVSDRAAIRFTLPETQAATVKVYDGQGNEVATLFNGEAKAKQKYEVEWKAANKPAGLYFLQLQTSTKKHQQKLLLTK